MHSLKAENVTCGYHGVPVLENVSLEVEQGQVVCLLGPNGVGKTTLFDSLLGFLPLISGQVDVDGQARSSYSRRQFAQKVAYVPQLHESAFAYSVIDVVLTGCASRLGWFSTPARADYDRADRMLDELGVSYLRNSLFTEISGGEQQMVLIARSLMQDSRILVMDEPAAALDFGNQVSVLSCIKGMAARGHGIIMTTHNPDHAFLCCTDAVLITKDKQLIAGSVESVVTEKNLRQAYGIDVKVVETVDRRGKPVSTCVPLLA